MQPISFRIELAVILSSISTGSLEPPSSGESRPERENQAVDDLSYLRCQRYGRFITERGLREFGGDQHVVIQLPILAVGLALVLPAVAYLAYAFVRGFIIEFRRLQTPGYTPRTEDDGRDDY